MKTEMGKQAAIVVYVAAMVAVIVGVDIAFFQKPIVGTAASEYWHCLGIRSFLLEIPQASMNKKFGMWRQMKARLVFKVLGPIAILAISPLLISQTKDKPTESEHRTGPHGVEGWTLEYSLPDSNYGDEHFAFTLVLARNGRRLRRIGGDPIIWKWMFWADGQQVAYETGPLHFGMSCVLADVKTGRKLAILDCYHKLPANVPAWVTALNP